MRNDLGSALVAAGVIGVSLILGFIAGVFVWAARVNVVARADGDPIDPVMAMFDSSAFLMGLVATLVTSLVVSLLLGWVVRTVSRRGPSA